MKKLLLVLALLALTAPAFASVGVRVNGSMVGIATDINIGCGTGTNSAVSSDGGIFNILCSPNLVSIGLMNSGYVSLATVDTGIPVSYSYVRKAISNVGTATDSLPNGTPGQILVLDITTVAGSGTWTVTPVTKTGFTSLVFNAALQKAELLYVSDTLGWILIGPGASASGANITINP